MNDFETLQPNFTQLYSYTVESILMSIDPTIHDTSVNDCINSIIETLEDAESDFKERVKRARYDTQNDSVLSDSIVQRLMNQKSTPQRTLEWYKQGLEVLTASQFATILKSPRVRGQLVMEKAKELVSLPTDPPRLCCYSDEVRPFDWGIRFEPVIKQLYESITKTKLADLGRLIHTTKSNLAASPDGLVVEDLPDSSIKRKGRLVEFKAPITRVITTQVPQDYFIQMQIQLEVADVDLCDYFEVSFVSGYGKKPYVEPQPQEKEQIISKGTIYLIISKETDKLLRYDYPPLDAPTDYTPCLGPDETIAETIPWHCTHTHLKTVERDKAWFESMQPHIESFWSDVQGAKHGTYILPESSRKKKEVKCEIVDSS